MISCSSNMPYAGLGLRCVEQVLLALLGIKHLVGFQRNSARYVNKLINSTWSPVFKIKMLSRELVIINPDLNRELAKHSADLGLAAFAAATVGKHIVRLSKEGLRLFTEVDTHPAFRAEFVERNNLKQLLEQSVTFFLSDQVAALPNKVDVAIGEWVYDLTAATAGRAIFGPKNLWHLDREYMVQFRILAESYDTLYYPAPWLTARRAYKAREYLLSRLRSFHLEHRESRVDVPAHRVNVVSISDPDWEANSDYYHAELLMSLAIIPTMATTTVWLVRHLLARQDLLKLVIDEIEQLREINKLGISSEDGKTSGHTVESVDLSSLKDTCPWLVASWYEVLRLHTTGVPRAARQDFGLAVPSMGSTVPFSAGDFLLIPMCTSNLDSGRWGPEAVSFNPARFITTEGRLSSHMIRKVRAFGMSGNLCPGRFYGSTTAMAVVAAVLLTVDISPKRGSGFREPRVRSGFSGGFERYADDEQAVLTRKFATSKTRLIFKV
ncbi:cytochrome P450 [Xylariales sp. PMI_506]|nr:cytochrome P450 [Xylariales sp. PMI_506]